MNIVLLGADGQLGQQLRVALAGLGPLLALGRGTDIADFDALADAIRQHQPQAIVNAAAYTAVDKAEDEPDRAYAVNARACELLAREAQRFGAWLVHYSTDYVFDGSGSRPWREDDTPAPLNVYGASKLAGETAIRAGCDRHLILRTSWVYESGRSNFINSILKAACSRDSLTVVDDQWGAPARALSLARETARILPLLEPDQAGLYHFTAAGETSRFELARHALDAAAHLNWPLRTRPEALLRAKTAQMPTRAQRPLNSRLDCGLYDRTFSAVRSAWQQEVSSAIALWPMIDGS